MAAKPKTKWADEPDGEPAQEAKISTYSAKAKLDEAEAAIDAAIEERKKAATRIAPLKDVEAESQDDGKEEAKEDEVKEDDVRVHESVHLLRTGEDGATLGEVLAYIEKKVTTIKTVVRPHYTVQGNKVPGCFVAVLLPIDAKKIQSQIDAANKSQQGGGKAGTQRPRTIFSKIEPLRLNASWEWPQVSKQYSDSFFIRIPKRMPIKPVKKHLEDLLSRLRGKNLIEPSQYEIFIPELKKHHQNQCIVRFQTRTAAERRIKKNPHLKSKIKLSSLADEECLPFVRYIIHNCMWPEEMPLLDNDPDPEHDQVDSVDSEPAPQLEPYYFIVCNWNRRKLRQQQQTAQN